MAAGPFPAVRKLAVHRFRNYVDAALEVNAPAVVLTGPNGAGKTNLLEALSFLAPGRGLRAARLSEVDRLAPSNMPAAWAVSAEIDDGDGPVRIGTGRDPAAAGDRRLVRIDGVPARGQTVLGDHLAVTWLTPAMDRLFAEG
ncbi:MAG: AAA family ATPase, partial [Pseudomonadota bacterium]|nr:AAA family ATPase [Pseudomonadota bacterium]